MFLAKIINSINIIVEKEKRGITNNKCLFYRLVEI